MLNFFLELLDQSIISSIHLIRLDLDHYLLGSVSKLEG